jgi:hypothetical protein
MATLLSITAAIKTIAPTATPWEAEVDAEEVLDEICTTIRRFVSLKDSQCRAVALWVVLTYLHDAVDILPLLLITSPEEACGKTTLLKVVFYLSNRPVPAGNISAAAIYRTIKDIAPTMALDEVDTYLKENEEPENSPVRRWQSKRQTTCLVRFRMADLVRTGPPKSVTVGHCAAPLRPYRPGFAALPVC